MKIILKIGLFICAGFLGGQGQPAAAPTVSAPSALPTEFSSSYEIAFEKTPQLTAQRILNAYDGLTAYGPVTYEAVQGHAMLQALVEKDQGRGGILAADLNRRGYVTRIEFETRSAFSIDNADRLAGVFEFDETHDELMSLEEAVQFGQDLFEAPIERYLMLFDLDGDGVVVRDEVMTGLGEFVGTESGLL